METPSWSPQNILVGIDFSPQSEAALAQAMWLAERTGAKVAVAHVLSDVRKAMMDMPTDARWQLVAGDVDAFERSLRSKSDAKLDALIASYRQRGLNISRMTLLGVPSVEMIHAVLKWKYDLVVTGTKGLGAVKRIFIGSTAENLVRKCPAPVWIVKESAPLNTVLAPVDFSPVSAKSLRLAGALAHLAAAKLVVLHAINNPLADELEALQMEKEEAAVDEQLAASRAGGEARLRELVAEHVDASVASETIVVSDEAPAAIAVAATQTAANLIVMGSVSRSGLPGYLLGNTAEKVLRTTDCSMLTIKPDGFISPIDPPFWKLHPDDEPST
jgi:nucleotide-binding universal stress UspA family protein